MLRKLKQRVKTLTLVPFADGRYEVFVNGRQLWSKLESGRFPEEDEIVKAIVKAGA